ncbi:histidine kinase [Nonomuraea sp. NPDC023979]|uniref:sensor histidine kinase n=1 Tax=Nonomuraea sp. NPDC023979 TaxID=3154796 RepID=UPI0034071D53
MKTFALVCGMGVVVVYSTLLATGNQPDARPLDLAGYVLLAVAALGLAWLPRDPVAALVACAGAAALCFVQGYAYAFWCAPALIAVFAAIDAGRRAAGWAGAAFLVAVPLTGAIAHPSADRLVGVVIWALLVLVVAQPAEVSRARRDHTAEAERRAADAERTREEEALRRAQEERLRVARELHDVTSHTISVIALHAAVAAEAVTRAGGPPEAAAALQVIRASSRQAMTEMKTILGILRPTAAGAGERQPQPGAAQLPALAGSAGLPVTLEVAGARRDLPPVVDLAVYRIVQEALTNTLRHAAATRAAVTLTYEPDAVRVRVEDDGAGAGAAPASPGPEPEQAHARGQAQGHGLTGMAERVAAAGGRLSTGDGPAGGFRVDAWLPA